MKIKHVILRRSIGATFGKFGVRSSGTSIPFSIEIDELTSNRAAEVSLKKGVEAVAPVVPMRLHEPVVFSMIKDPFSDGSTWGVKAVHADTSPFMGNNVTVAILDTGIDSSNSAFSGISLVQKNFTTETGDDIHGHGTHCAGTIAGRNNVVPRFGIAPGISKLLIGKVISSTGSGSDTLLEAIEWAIRNDANLISMSLGIDFPGFVLSLEQQGFPPKIAVSKALEGYRTNVIMFERIASLVDSLSPFGKLCIIIAAAGNESQRNINPNFKIAVCPPAVAGGIISVAALGPSKGGLTIAPFSNYGARVSGPGVDVLSAKLGGGLISMSGTSMATPHVTGVAALWIEKLKNARQLNRQLLIDRLMGSCIFDELENGFDPSDVGAGMICAPQA